MPSTPTVSVREWTDVVRRARLGRTTKHVAWTLATYADYTNGDRIFPGLPTLAVAAEVDYKTAKKALAALLAAGLIEVVKSHPGVRQRGTEYRLALGEDLMERVEVLSPAQFDLAADEVRRANSRRRSTGAPGPRTPGGKPVDNSEVQGQPTPTPEPSTGAADPCTAGEVQGRAFPQNGGVQGSARPQYRGARSARTSIDQPTTTNPHTSADLRTAVTPVDNPAAVDDPDPPLPDRCKHGLRARRRDDGQPSCALCRREAATGPPDNVIPLPVRRTA